jgi:hypothetical protein
MWCVARLDEDEVTPREDVLALYEKPYDPQEPVVCLDEKPVSRQGEVRPPIPAAPGRAVKRDSEYPRCGTGKVFCAVERKAGRPFTWPTPDRSGREFAKVIGALAGHYPWGRTIHLVLDNLNLHCRQSLRDACGAKEGSKLWSRLKFHHTPKHGSWLNQAAIEISLFSRPCLGRRRIGDLASLKGQARAWNRRTNHDHVTLQWQFERQAARRTFGYSKNPFMRSKN